MRLCCVPFVENAPFAAKGVERLLHLFAATGTVRSSRGDPSIGVPPNGAAMDELVAPASARHAAIRFSRRVGRIRRAPADADIAIGLMTCSARVGEVTSRF